MRSSATPTRSAARCGCTRCQPAPPTVHGTMSARPVRTGAAGHFRSPCARAGYLPWPAGGDLALYNACVRMVRADYCGQGEGTTRNGMRIDLYDDAGIQKADNDPVQEFEAGWNAAGAVCVRHVRVKENTSLDALAKSCPRLREHLGPSCTEAGA